MLEELQEKGMTDTTVIIRKGQPHKVKKRELERERPRPSKGTKTDICVYNMARVPLTEVEHHPYLGIELDNISPGTYICKTHNQNQLVFSTS